MSTKKKFWNIAPELGLAILFVSVVGAIFATAAFKAYFAVQPMKQDEVAQRVDSFAQEFSSEQDRASARLCLRETMTSPTSPFVKDGVFKVIDLQDAKKLCEDMISTKRRNAFRVHLEGLIEHPGPN